MNASSKVREFLNASGLPSKIHCRDAPGGSLADSSKAHGIPMARIARAVLLQDDNGLLLAVFPASRLLDFSALHDATGRQLKPVPSELATRTFADCDPGSVPPLPDAYALPGIMDESLWESSAVFFEPGKSGCLAGMRGRDFKQLNRHCLRASFARRQSELSSNNPYEFVLPNGVGDRAGLHGLMPARDMRQRIEQLDSLPPMPGMARQLLRLRNSNSSTAADLAAIVESDPSLAAQVVSYAGSAFFNFPGEVRSVGSAITQVLGFDTVMNIALGLAAGRALRVPADGPLGLNAFWRHAIHSATLSQNLAQTLPTNLRVKPGLAYLSGLLHDLGFLLLGHLFKSEFFLLNRMVGSNPEVPVTLMEKWLLGVEHTELGADLLQHWDMPGEITTATRFHHDETYSGEHATYAHLILLSDHLLKGHGIGDGATGELPESILTALGVSRETALEQVQRVLESGEELDTLARQLAA